MAVVSGTVCILAGVARLGFVTELLSKPIRYGYMNGIALTVLMSQLPKLFGFSVEGDGLLAKAWAFAQAVLDGRTNVTALMVGAGTLAVILLLKDSKRVPGILIAVVGATVFVGALDLAARAGVSILGPLPQGLPEFAIPWITSSRYRPGHASAAARSPSCRSPTPACSRAPMLRGPALMSTPIRRWWGSGRPTWPRDSFRAFPSAAARHARRWPKPRAPGRS